MKRMLMVGMVMGLLAVPVLAERSAASAAALGVSSATATSGTRASLFEDFESFSVGALVGQNGWGGYGANVAVSDAGPIAGAKSARHTSDGSEYSGLELSGPAFTPSYGILAADICLSGMGVTYQFASLGDVAMTSTGTYFNTRVQFNPDGTIAALQAVGGNAVFAPTNGYWTPGVPFQIAIETAADGALTVYQNAAPIFTGTEIGFAMQGVAGQSKQYYGWTDNAPGCAGVSMTIDNFTNVLVPEPTSLGIVGAVLTLLRRRR